MAVMYQNDGSIKAEKPIVSKTIEAIKSWLTVDKGLHNR